LIAAIEVAVVAEAAAQGRRERKRSGRRQQRGALTLMFGRMMAFPSAAFRLPDRPAMPNPTRRPKARRRMFFATGAPGAQPLPDQPDSRRDRGRGRAPCTLPGSWGRRHDRSRFEMVVLHAALVVRRLLALGPQGRIWRRSWSTASFAVSRTRCARWRSATLASRGGSRRWRRLRGRSRAYAPLLIPATKRRLPRSGAKCLWRVGRAPG